MQSLMVTLRHIYFLQCSSCHEDDFVDLEARVCFPCYGCPPFGETDFVDFEVLIYFLQCSFEMESIFWTPRHELICFPCYGCPHFGEADFVDLEVRIYFLQCSM